VPQGQQVIVFERIYIVICHVPAGRAPKQMPAQEGVHRLAALAVVIVSGVEVPVAGVLGLAIKSVDLPHCRKFDARSVLRPISG
jgi:hypothetical protein